MAESFGQAEGEPKNVEAQYSVPVSSSVVRLGKLLAVRNRKLTINKSNYTFEDQHSFPAWNHILAGALSANTACFLINNDIPMKHRSGFGDPKAINMTDLLVAMKYALYGELIIHNSVKKEKLTT